MTLVVHTAAMLAVMSATTLLAYHAIALRVLRKCWVNFDVMWAVALIASVLFLYAF